MLRNTDALPDYALNAGAIAASASLPMHLIPMFVLTFSKETIE
jgi:hypothetical protein